MMKFLKKDSYWIGIGLAAIVPVIIYFILHYTVVYFSEKLTNGIPLIQPHNVILVSIFLNLIIFYRYINKKDYDKSGRGVMIITFIYTIIYFIWRFAFLA